MFKKRKRRVKKITSQQKRLIAAEYLKNDNIPEVAKLFDLSESAIEKIVYGNLNLKKAITEKLAESMQTASGIVGNTALEVLKKKDLSKEKVSTLSTLSSEMYKIHRGDGPSNMVQVNVNMPTSRDSIMDYLKKSAKITETPDNNIVEAEPISETH